MNLLIQTLVRLRPHSIESVLSQMLGLGECESGLQGGWSYFRQWTGAKLPAAYMEMKLTWVIIIKDRQSGGCLARVK